ncbi:glycoprotein [Joa yellow blotch virus]|uniref:Glycoprotein n=1 Tax=joa yellow blotch associated virus TaxID=3070922 RepID=A0AAE7UUQ8_9RHAB|nr:glycoprotein [Joa yellow blotch virus]QUI75405.1 glycoprotein [joa yellow blotch associated virus]
MRSIGQIFFVLVLLRHVISEFLPDGYTDGTTILPPPSPPPLPPPPSAPPAQTDPGLAAYQETHTDTMYDVIPIYQCNSTGIGYAVSEWYGICKDQCSYSTERSTWNISLYDYQNYVATIPVFATTVVSVTKTAHVSFFGTCLTYVSDEKDVNLNYTTFRSQIPLLLNHTAGTPGSTAVLDNTVNPDCSYWADNTITGNVYTMDTDSWPLMISITGDLLIKNPYSLSFTPYNDSAVYFNGKWFFWDQSNTHHAPSCALTPAGDDSCKLNSNLGVLSCEGSGVVINLNGAVLYNNTCVGSINISSNSIPFTFTKSLTTPPVKEKLQDLLGSSNPSYTGITDLLDTVSDTIDTLEDTYCSALCDLSDRSFQTIVEDEDVVDTPNGPWLPVQNGGVTRLVPCSVDVNWLISFPLTVCVTDNLIKISRMGSSDVHWWDPSVTYFDPQRSCDHVNVNAYEIYMKKKANISITFWRGTAYLDYPYTGPVRWVPRGNPNSIRSSKWFPQIKNLSDAAKLTMSILGDTITQSVSRSVNTSSGNSYVEYSTNQLSFLVSKIWTDICIISTGIWNFLTGVIGYGTSVLMTLVAVYLGGILLKRVLAPRRNNSWADM